MNKTRAVKVSNKATIVIHYLAGVTPIEQTDVGDWIDLRSARYISLKAGEYTCIPLGVSMRLPKGYEAHIIPRSSLFKKTGLIQTNGMGLIDSSYCGDGDEWMLPVLATRDCEISMDERICQFRIVKKMRPIRFKVVSHLRGKDRNGFGSTGKF